MREILLNIGRIEMDRCYQVHHHLTPDDSFEHLAVTRCTAEQESNEYET